MRNSLSFNGHPPLGVNATISVADAFRLLQSGFFQWAPTLGGECYSASTPCIVLLSGGSFNGHPPLGVNATVEIDQVIESTLRAFQWAPTLGGECYFGHFWSYAISPEDLFQWAPTLGGECYQGQRWLTRGRSCRFQWAPTFGGKCYLLLMLPLTGL